MPDTVEIEGTGTNEFNVVTMPTDATIAAESDATGVATVTVAEKKVTITGVAEGHAIITVTTSAEGYATQKKTILVNVK